jgi:hypothetical protein
MSNPINEAAAKSLRANTTISMATVEYEDGSWGVHVYLTGLTSEKHAEAARDHMARQFCGDAIKAQG